MLCRTYSRRMMKATAARTAIHFSRCRVTASMPVSDPRVSFWGIVEEIGRDRRAVILSAVTGGRFPVAGRHAEDGVERAPAQETGQQGEPGEEAESHRPDRRLPCRGAGG